MPTDKQTLAARPVDPDYAAKKAEIDRFCDPHADQDEFLVKIVRHLGDKTLADPDYRASMADLIKVVTFRGGTDKTPIVDVDNRKINTILHDARTEGLPNFYARPESENRVFRIHLPKKTEQPPDANKLHAPYKLVFIREEPVDPSIAVWQQMVHGIEGIHEILLIFDTPAIVIDGIADTTGRWSGSGEVAAASLVSQRVAQLKPRIEIDIRRWCDMRRGQPELQEWHRCLIILGSSIKNKLIRRLRKRKRLKGRQVYRFEDSGQSGGSQGLIRKQWSADGMQHQQDFICSYDEDTDIATEFALVSFFRDPANRQTLIALQGISSFGTRAAAAFMCSAAGIVELKSALETAGHAFDDGLSSFELLLRVHVEENNTLGEILFEEIVLHEEPAL